MCIYRIYTYYLFFQIIFIQDSACIQTSDQIQFWPGVCVGEGERKAKQICPAPEKEKKQIILG